MTTYPFQILKQHLAEELPELREIDWYLQQDSTTDTNAQLYASPIVYIEFLPLDPVDIGFRIQQAEAEFNLHLLTSNVMDSGKRVKKDTPTDHMYIFDKLYNAVHGFSAKLSYLQGKESLLNTPSDQRIMNSISRVAITPPHKPRKGVMKSIQRFKCIIWDHAALANYEDQALGIDITVEIDQPS